MYDDDRITLDLEPDQLPAGAGGFDAGEVGVVVHRTETAYVECDRRGDHAHLFLRVEGPYPSLAGGGCAALDREEVAALRDLLSAWLARGAG
jgi:hypothetical protein